MAHILERPSPNFDRRGDDATIDMLVLHYTGMQSAEEALSRMCDPAAKVSAHYCIDEDGTLHRLVAEEARAWHAGVACWRGAHDVNARSIGIELVNPGHEFGYRPFPEAQMALLVDLCHEIVGRHAIPARNVVGHSDVAPLRKQDPGELFDWRRLAEAGIGHWPDEAGAQSAAPDIGRARQLLGAIGYCLPRQGLPDDEEWAETAIVTAFQRHFRPARCDGRLDGETMGRLQALAAMIDSTAPNA
ncbi:MAG: N-acetylmuramoyl-L-alanine amidase [Rhodovibrionaceae bacterium]|nr:N-acetylmuramoyl-L-alanine amidase [Rhodovibrionaceae bacterium]